MAIKRLIPAAACLAFCATALAQQGRWISFDPNTRTYSIQAREVPRGDLLDDLRKVTGINVLPRDAEAERITLQARGVALSDLVSRVMPREARVVLRVGEGDTPFVNAKPGAKVGPAAAAPPGSKPKRADGAGPLLATGTLKPEPGRERPRDLPDGPGVKPRAEDVVRVAQGDGPRKPSGAPLPRDTVRLTLRFEVGAAPRVIAAQSLEGRRPEQREVVGRYLYAVTAAGGNPLEYGTFQDPLEIHSYLKEGPHSVGTAPEGVAGISVLRENLARGRLIVVDLAGTSFAGPLSTDTVRTAIERGKVVASIELASVVPTLDQGAPR